MYGPFRLFPASVLIATAPKGVGAARVIFRSDMFDINFGVATAGLAVRPATGPAPFKKSPIGAERLDFRPDFWKFRGPVLAYSGPFWRFWTSRIDSG